MVNKVLRLIVKGTLWAAGLSLAVLYGASIGALSQQYLISQKPYKLTILGHLNGLPTPMYQALVTDVTHKPDGALCFYLIQHGKRACLKFDTYDLTEIELQ